MNPGSNYYDEIEGKIGDAIERVVPHVASHNLYMDHLARYKFAAPFLRDRSILDIGCGTGYGSFLLAGEASDVLGADYSTRAIDFAKEYFYRENLVFQAMKWEALQDLNKTFNGITAFEFIEHIKDQEAFLKTVKNILSKDGIFVVSSPNKVRSPGTNPFHVNELDFYEFKDMLSKYFSKVTIYGQFLRPEYLKRKEYILKELSRYAIRSLTPAFIRHLIPREKRIRLWEKITGGAKQSKGTEASKPPDNIYLQDLIGITEHDILFTSSNKDILSSDNLLAVCKEG